MSRYQRCYECGDLTRHRDEDGSPLCLDNRCRQRLCAKSAETALAHGFELGIDGTAQAVLLGLEEYTKSAKIEVSRLVWRDDEERTA